MCSPFRLCSIKVLFSMTWDMQKGPSHKLSNFPCLYLSSLRASHFRMRSPSWKTSCFAFLSKAAFILTLKICACSLTASLSYWSSINWKILLWISFLSSTSSCKYFMTGILNWIGRITSIPYTSWKGDVPMDFLVLIRYAQSAYFKLVSHDLLFLPTFS